MAVSFSLVPLLLLLGSPNKKEPTFIYNVHTVWYVGQKSIYQQGNYVEAQVKLNNTAGKFFCWPIHKRFHVSHWNTYQITQILILMDFSCIQTSSVVVDVPVCAAAGSSNLWSFFLLRLSEISFIHSGTHVLLSNSMRSISRLHLSCSSRL